MRPASTVGKRQLLGVVAEGSGGKEQNGFVVASGIPLVFLGVISG